MPKDIKTTQNVTMRMGGPILSSNLADTVLPCIIIIIIIKIDKAINQINTLSP